VQRPQAATDAEEKEQGEEGEEGENGGAGVPGRVGEGTQRASRAAGRGRPENTFTRGQPTACGPGGKDSAAAATTAATEQAFARAYVRDPLRASAASAGLRSGDAVPRGAASRAAAASAATRAAAARRRSHRACGRGGHRGVRNRLLDRALHLGKRRCRRKRRHLGHFRKRRNRRNLRNLNRWKLGEWRKLCRGSRAGRHDRERENDQ
jgi:hypothetical protein